MMRRKLVLLGGPVGVGKSTVVAGLAQHFERAGVLDADDVWRVSPVIKRDTARPNAIENVTKVLRGYFEAGCDLGIVAWVFARPALYEPVMEGLEDLVDDYQQLYLIAAPNELEKRIRNRKDARDPAGVDELVEYSLGRLAMIEDLPFARIDTTSLTVEQVVQQVVEMVR